MPSTNAAAVARDATTAEWLLGMPPVDQKMWMRISFAVLGRFRRSMIQDLRICAMNQLQKAERNTGLDKARERRLTAL
jgi:hypothetical protein